MQSLPSVSPLNGLSLQDHLLCITLLTWRALCPRSPNSDYASLPPMSPPSGLPFQELFLSIMLLTRKTLLQEVSTEAIVSPPCHCLPFKDHQLSIILTTQEFCVPEGLNSDSVESLPHVMSPLNCLLFQEDCFPKYNCTDSKRSVSRETFIVTPQGLAPQCHCQVACHFKAIPWV